MVASKFDFWKPDRKGFEKLLSESFTEYKGMLFRKSLFKTEEVDRRLHTVSSMQVQRELNHEPLILLGVDVDAQRKWAEELEKAWQRKFEAEFPHLTVTFNRDDTGKEIIVTFWAVRK